MYPLPPAPPTSSPLSSPPSHLPTIPTHPAHLEAVVGPGGELHDALLLVEWEELNVDGARGAEYGGGEPRHVAVRGHNDVGA